MKDINEVFNKVELERKDDTIVLKAKIMPQFYTEILKAFFSYSGIVEDTLNGKKRYVSDIASFSYYQLSFGQISRFEGQIAEKIGDLESTIVIKEEQKDLPKNKNTESIVSIYEDAKSNNLIDVYISSNIESTEKFLNFMETSMFDQKVATKKVVNKFATNAKRDESIELKALDNKTENITEEMQEKKEKKKVDIVGNIKKIFSFKKVDLEDEIEIEKENKAI